MTSRYGTELDKLGSTYEWALRAPLDELRRFITASRDTPLLAIGSGGSLTAAALAAMLHQKTGHVGLSATPLQMKFMAEFIRRTSVLILSAGGRNTDVLSALRAAATCEPCRLLALSMRPKSVLAQAAARFRFVAVKEYEPPVRKDGFLATNSLLAMTVLLVRAYQDCCPTLWDNEPLLFEAQSARLDPKDVGATLSGSSTHTVLYGGWGMPAALDLESKLFEAALGSVQVVDYRNFAHGRHNWLAKRGLGTSVIALVSPGVRHLAVRILDLVPKGIPRLMVATDRSGPWGAVELILAAMGLVGALASAQGVDPARPGVPTFGRRMYHLGMGRVSSSRGTRRGLSSVAAAAICRKADVPTLNRLTEEQLAYWRASHRRFLRRLRSASFGAIVFDYDGTLCERDERFGPLTPDVCGHLRRLVQAELVVGVATGRGRSVGESMRAAIPPSHRTQVLVGYYNGSQIGSLDEDTCPDRTSSVVHELRQVEMLLRADAWLPYVAKISVRSKQISIEPISAGRDHVRRLLFERLRSCTLAGVRVVELDHSFDVLAPGVSKLALVIACKHLAAAKGNAPRVLCIGDKGAWPGNDFDLLSTKYSLSVDEVSTDPNSCWNLVPGGCRGVQAALGYLENLQMESGRTTFRRGRQGSAAP